MTDYNYTRELVDGRYNIDNKARVDGEGNQIHLAKEVTDALPSKVFKLICAAVNAKFVFELALSAEDKTILDNCVSAHKNNT